MVSHFWREVGSTVDCDLVTQFHKSAAYFLVIGFNSAVPGDNASGSYEGNFHDGPSWPWKLTGVNWEPCHFRHWLRALKIGVKKPDNFAAKV